MRIIFGLPTVGAKPRPLPIICGVNGPPGCITDGPLLIICGHYKE